LARRYRVNRYVRGVSDDVDAVEALADFRRFPTWMWRNTVVVEFIEWLRAHNASARC
jgi:erythromycin esterase-like protein